MQFQAKLAMSFIDGMMEFWNSAILGLKFRLYSEYTHYSNIPEFHHFKQFLFLESSLNLYC